MWFAGWEVRKYKTVTVVFRAEGSIFKARIAVFHPKEREIYFFLSLPWVDFPTCGFPNENLIVLESASKNRLL